jgi:hypothetical protein
MNNGWGWYVDHDWVDMTETYFSRQIPCGDGYLARCLLVNME